MSNVVVSAKSYSRNGSFALDFYSKFESLLEAQTYASGPIAYAGQPITVLNTDTDKYEQYILQPSDSGYTLEKPGVDPSAVKQYVVVVDALPGSNQVEGVLYINTTDKTGSVWKDSAWVQVFKDVSSDVTDLKSRMSTVESGLTEKAPINNPVFTGTVTLAADPTQNLEAVTKQYVDRLVAGLQEASTPGIVDGTDSPLPTTDYTAGQMWRVSVAGTYAGQVCEPGDLIICLKDYEVDSASNDDFLVVQANIDGAVTSSADASTDGNLVVFDGITGKIIKDSAIAVASLSDAIAKAHEHANKEILDSYDKNQTDLLAAAQATAQGLVTPVQEQLTTLESTVAGKANSADVYTKTDVDEKIDTLTTAVNGKVDAATVDQKIKDKIGEIPDGTSVKTYVDTAVGSGGTASAEAIAQAKEEAITASKSYTDTKVGNLGEDPDVVTYVTNKINLALNVVEF